MSDIPHHTAPVSGIAEGSRSARRIRPREHGPSVRIAPALIRLPALAVSWIVANVCVVFLAVFMIGLGYFVTEVLLRSQAIANADDWLPEWFAAHRTPFWNDWSQVASYSADVYVIVPLVASVATYLVIRRRWRTASFVVQCALCETLCYSITVYFVSRLRPEVVRLDTFNINHSFPSGHTAVAFSVYGGIALLLAAHFKAWPVRAAIWGFAALLALDVAFGRMYRGEHHPIDVAGGALMGIGTLMIALFAARTSTAVAELRHERREEPTL
jgi:membrane-associated phospholipid phosphatase